MYTKYGKMLGRRWPMLVFSEYQTGTIDLSLSFYGYEECTPNYSLVQLFEIPMYYITLLKKKVNSIIRGKLLI